MRAITALQQALLGLIMPAVLLCVGIAFIDQSLGLRMFKYRSAATVLRDNQVEQLNAPAQTKAAPATSSGLVPPPPPFPFSIIR